MEIFMMNNQFGICNWKNCSNPSSLHGFLISRRPIFGIALEIKRVNKSGVFSLRKPKCGTVNALSNGEYEDNRLTSSNKLLEKEIKFQPSFDEYLKAMESVKTGREKIPIPDAKSNKQRKVSTYKHVIIKPELEGDGEKLKLSLEENLGPVKNTESVERNEILERSSIHVVEERTSGGKLGIRERGTRAFRDKNKQRIEVGISEKGGVRTWVSGQRKVNSRESNMSLKVERGMRKDGDNRTSESRDGRWLDRDSSVEQKMSLKVKRGMRKDGDSRTSERRDGRWMDRDSSVEQKMSLKVERGMRKDGDNRPSKRRDGRWKDQDSSVEQKMGNSDLSRIRKNNWVNEREREFDGDKSFTSNEDAWGGELGQNGYRTQLQKKQMIQNRSQVQGRVSIRDGSMNFSHISKGGSEKISLYKAKREGTLTDNQRFSDKKELYKREIKTEWKSDEGHEAMDSKGMSEKEYYHVSNFETNMEDTDIALERGNSYENRNPVRLMNVSEIKNYGPRHTMADSRLDGGHVEVGTRRRTSQKSGKSRRENMVSMDDVENSGHEVERAAFASYEEFTDIKGMPRVSRAEMEERIQNLAKWLNGMDINLPEWMFSKTMRSARIKFTDSSILRVIQILGSYGNWRRVLQVIEWLQLRERFKSYKSRYIYTTALNVLGKAKRPVEALNIFHSMRRELSSYPDLAAYHCIAVTLGQAGYMKELLDVIDCMRSLPQKKINIGVLEKWDPRLEPDIVVYNAVLNACVRRKQWEGAFWVLQQLKEQSLQPTSTTYGLVMEVMFVCAKYNLVHEFFRKVEKSSTPNSLNYKVIVNTLWKEGKIDEAVVAVQDMERRGIVASASLYYDLARCLCSAGRCQDALMQMDKICKVASKPLVVTYTGLIQACLESGNVLDGAYIFEQMQKFCSPNIVTCNIMLKGYLEHGMFEEANDMFKRMLDNDSQISSKADCKGSVLPDNYTFNTMLDACVFEKRWDDFKYVYQHMLHHGFYFNAKRHLRMVLEACRAGKGELAETTWKHLVHADRIPPAPIAKERFCMRLEENDYTGAISCIAGPQKSELHSFSEKLWLDLFKANEKRFQKDTLVRLIHEVSKIVAGNDHPRPIFQNLLTSCREFIRTQMTVADNHHSIPNERTLLLEVDA